MKKILFIVVMAMTFSACSNNPGDISTDMVKNPEAGNTDFPEMKFEKTTYDFGTIKEDEVVAYSFLFTNVGKGDLLISNAQASCGCTVPDWPRHPIKPGEQGKIDVKFDSHSKGGQTVDKTVTLMSNCENAAMELHIKGTVQKKEENK